MARKIRQNFWPNKGADRRFPAMLSRRQRQCATWQRRVGKSIAALEKLNALGYGKPDSGLILNLVYNPVGTPAGQKKLEAAYREHLHKNFGLVFNSLFTITNMPIRRSHMLDAMV